MDRSGTTSTFAELRAFACAAIPDLLREAGGELDKERMVEEVERRFASGRQRPEDLDRVNAAGVRTGRNAIAWAMRDLVMAGVLRRSAGRPEVRLAEPPRPHGPSHEERIRVRAQQRARDCCRRAEKEGLPYDEAFMAAAGEQVERQGFRCAVTGLPFDLDEIGEGAGASHYAPSPDRIVPGLGYVPGNVRWVLWMVNRAKGRMTEEQFLVMCRAIVAALERSQPGI